MRSNPSMESRIIVYAGLRSSAIRLDGPRLVLAPYTVGGEVSDSAWRDVSLFVLAYRFRDVPGSTDTLLEPHASRTLLAVMRDLQRAGGSMVERVIIENTDVRQPNSGVLKEVSDIYCSTDNFRVSVRSGHQVSLLAEEVISRLGLQMKGIRR